MDRLYIFLPARVKFVGNIRKIFEQLSQIFLQIELENNNNEKKKKNKVIFFLL